MGHSPISVSKIQRHKTLPFLFLGSSQIRVGSRPISWVYPPRPPSVRQSPAQAPRGLVAHAGSTIQLDDGRDDATEFGCGTAAVLAAASTWAATKWTTVCSDGQIVWFPKDPHPSVKNLILQHLWIFKKEALSHIVAGLVGLYRRFGLHVDHQSLAAEDDFTGVGVGDVVQIIVCAVE